MPTSRLVLPIDDILPDMLDLLFSQPYAFVVIFGGIILAIAIHEAAHSFAADKLGDPTPRSLGRTTLNPLAHLDPIGTLVLLVTGAFGWGKPAPYDPYNLRNPERDSALIALAGPASNIVLAILFALLLYIPSLSFIDYIIALLIRININLALFNLLPVPPLDGSKIFLKSNPFSQQNSLFLLFLLILPIFGGYSLASLIISPISSSLFRLLTSL